MRKVIVVGPTSEEAEKAGNAVKECLSRDVAKFMRAEGEPPPPRELTASSVTFVPFRRGSEQAGEAPERTAPGEEAVYYDKRGRRVIKVGEEEVLGDFCLVLRLRIQWKLQIEIC